MVWANPAVGYSDSRWSRWQESFHAVTTLHFQFKWQHLAPLARNKERSLSYSVFQWRKTKTFWFQPKLPSGYIHCTKWPFFPNDCGGRQHKNATEKNKNGIFCLITVLKSHAWERQCCRNVIVLELERSEFNLWFLYSIQDFNSSCVKQEQFSPFHPTFIVNFLWEELGIFCVLWWGTASVVAILILGNEWECESVCAGFCSLGLAIQHSAVFLTLPVPRPGIAVASAGTNGV